VGPYFENPAGSFSPLLQVTPLRYSYALNVPFVPASAVTVYRQEEAGGTRLLSFAAGEFTVKLTSPLGGAVTLVAGVQNTHTLNTAGDWKVEVSAAGLNAQPFTITVESGGGSVTWPPEVQVVTFKNTYASGDSIDVDNDLAVYTRDTATGAMANSEPYTGSGSQTGKFTLSPATITGTPGQCLTVTVTVHNYPIATTDTTQTYNVWVGTGGGSVTPSLLALPLRTTYSVGGLIDPAGDLRVYKSDTTGAYSPLTYGTEYTLTRDGGSEDPAAEPFTAAQVPTGAVIKVTDAAISTLSTTYGVNVINAGVEVLGVVYSDGTTGPNMKRNVQGAYVLDGPPRGKMIHTVKPLAGNAPIPGKAYRVGRMDHEAVMMNIDPAGDLSFRTAYSAGPYSGFIPVETSAELELINDPAHASTWLRGKYALTADLDLLGFATGTVEGLPQNWPSIGNTAPFTGEFEGAGRAIRGLKVTSPAYYNGLFSKVGTGGIVRNLTVEGEVTQTGSGQYTGGVAGWVDGGTLQNCENRAAVTSGGGYTGGVAGEVKNNGKLIDCVNRGPVQQNYSTNTGGIAGSVSLGATVTNCVNRGPVTGTGDVLPVGGVAGWVDGGGKLIACYNEGNVENAKGQVGGVAGNVAGASALSGCANRAGGKVKQTGTGGDMPAGGVAGVVAGGAALTNCYNEGTVENAASQVGGVAGNVNGATLSNCFNRTGGEVTQTGTAENTGGVAGKVEGVAALTGCYNEGNVESPAGRVGGVAGTVSGTSAVLSGCSNRAGGAVKQTTTDTTEKPAGGVAGRVEGGAALTNCYNEGTVDNKAYQTGGVAGVVVDGATTLSGCSNRAGGAVTSVGQHTGGVAGDVSDATLSGCSNWAGGSVTSGNQNIGGVAGKVTRGKLTGCANAGLVTLNGTGMYLAGGGVAGFVTGEVGNFSYLSNCSNTGTVTGTTGNLGAIGGVAGLIRNGGTLTNCVNRGAVTMEPGAGGETSAGGVAGNADTPRAALTGCTNAGPVVNKNVGRAYAGGVAGMVGGGATVTSCSNTARGSVTIETGAGTDNSAGGVAGIVIGIPVTPPLTPSSVVSCSNAGPVRNLQPSPAGGVAGMVKNSATVTNCDNSGAVESKGPVGGVAGYISNTTNPTFPSSAVSCSNRGAVTQTGTNPTGGVAGWIQSGGIATACYNTGAVNSNGDYTGGVAGKVEDSDITACYNTGAVTTSQAGSNNGGISGSISNAAVTACYNAGMVVVAGGPGDPIGAGATYTDCYYEVSTGAATPNGTSFTGVFTPSGSTEWGTGDGSGSGKYWKPGTTGGGMLPKLWFE
jgi:hypothetical protein